MSITPTFSEDGNSYSVLTSNSASLRTHSALSVILLNRTSWIFRSEVLEDLLSAGFTEIISVEESPVKFDVESMLERFPQVKFLVTSEPLSPGARINLAVQETVAEHFLVIWDDQRIAGGVTISKILDGLEASQTPCLVPELVDLEGQEVPSRSVPARQFGRFKILTLSTEGDGEEILFPLDFSALYERLRFMQSGGFDPTISNPFWQLADWGARWRLWGESAHRRAGLRLEYRSSLPVDDVSFDSSYRRFFLKNLAVRYHGRGGDLPLSRFMPYWFRTRQTFWRAWKDFSGVRAWVRENQLRFKSDSRALVELWGY